MKNAQKIYESKNFTISKGKHPEFDQAVVFKSFSFLYPSEEQIKHLDNEYELIRNLDIARVRKALKKEKYKGKNVLILEYFEGQTIKSFIRKSKLEIYSRLKIAHDIAQTLGEIHQQDIIHKDLNSFNILIDDNEQICIIDFGLATEYTLKNHHLSSPEDLAGMLEYISPEQTGRLNRGIDHRSDLYSLGIVLYELFTEKLPFADMDAMDLIHSHIAKAPVPPKDINENIPKIISDLILKLLEKNVESRYQSAFGLTNDLLELIEQRDISNFQLGLKDFSKSLSIPEKLYGREKETDTLNKIYKTAIEGETQLLLVSGLPGIGKSVLIREINKLIKNEKGHFIEGKFDQFQNNPYNAVIQSFTDFGNQILKKNDKELAYWKKLIQHAVGDIGGILTNLVPDIGLIIGKQLELQELYGKESQNRFNYLWANFIKAIATKEHPLVIFIDDLQWADTSSIELIINLLSDQNIKYLLFIIAYRDNEINKSDIQLFENIELVNLSSIKLENLKLSDVDALVSDTLMSENTIDYQALSELVHSKTLGNPFFTVQFLRNLYEEAFLKFDYKNNSWQWDKKEIEKQNFTDNVVRLLAGKIQKLQKDTQDILRIAACIGSRFDLNILSVICKKDKTDCKNILQPAIFEKLIQSAGKKSFKFTHDRIQQAVYATIPENEKNNFHLQTGKILLQSFNESERGDFLFDIVNQLNYGKDLLSSAETSLLSDLNYQAGIKAQISAAYSPAYNYFKISMELLPEKSWDNDYKKTLEIYNRLAESSYLSGFYEDTEKYVDHVIQNAKDKYDTIDAYLTLINSYASRTYYKRAFEKGMQLLAAFDFHMSLNTSQFRLIIEFLKAKIALINKGNDYFLNLPEITDKKQLAVLRIMDVLGTPIYSGFPKVFPIIVLRAIRMYAKYGILKSAVHYFTGFSVIHLLINKIEKAYTYGQLAKKLMQKYSDIKHEKFQFLYSYMNISRKDKIHTIVPEMKEVYKIASEVGNLEYASYGLINHAFLMFFCDTPLQKIQQITLDNRNTLNKLKQNLSLEFNALALQLYENLTLKSKDGCLLTGTYFNEENGIKDFLEHKNYNNLASYYEIKIILAVFFGNNSNAEKLLNGIDAYITAQQGTYYAAIGNFYGSLLAIQAFDSDKRIIRKRLRQNQGLMKIWAKYCPVNFQHKYYLVEAEKFRILGKNDQARDFYEKAIWGAKDNSFLNEEALAWQKAGTFYQNIGINHLARYYMQNAYNCYKQWGAKSVCNYLDTSYPDFKLSQKDGLHDPTSIPTTSIYSTSGQYSFFDLTSLVKANQSLAGEVKLENLLKSILMIIMENAGSEYAVVIRNDEGKFKIEAKGRHNLEQIEVLQSEDLEKTSSLALNVVNYVIRTRKFIVVDNAQSDSTYSDNEYIKRNKVKSVFCCPVIHRDKLVAILYLENNLSTHVFNSKRIETINILSSQIAVSIENALLYENLEAKVKSRTQELSLTNAELEKANNTKNKFFSIIAHDLKGPFGILMNMTELLYNNSEDYDEEKRQNVIKLLYRSSLKTFNLLQNLLTWSMAQMNGITYSPENLSLNSLISESVLLLENSANKKEISLVIDESKDVWGFVDKNMMLTVLRNLISNAIKFTKNNGTIKIGVKQHNNQNITVYVQDNGIGISKDHIGKLFRIDQKMTAFGTDNETGTGLGLILCKEFVEKHGGIIWVESEPGTGSVFSFTIPGV